MSYVFGPVASRRLGRSLGIDLIPFKTCPYDCTYCQLGCTTTLTLERREWVPLDAILAQLKEKLTVQHPDYITLGGSGEPTLYSRLGELIDHIRQMTQARIAVLTNGALLWQEQVRRELLGATLVIPSLDAGDEASFRVVNRPHAGLGFEKMLEGLIAFRKEFSGQYWLEVFLLAGQTDSLDQVKKMAECVKRIGPDRVQLNTVARPPAESYAVGVSHERLEELAGLFEPRAEVIADFRAVQTKLRPTASCEEVLELLRRHTCTLEGITQGLGCEAKPVLECLESLEQKGLVEIQMMEGSTERFYRIVELQNIPVK